MGLRDLIDEQKLGPRDWGVRPTTAGFIFHTDEYSGHDRATALRVIADQSRRGPGGTWIQPGSYNLHIHYTDGKVGVIEAVPVRHASGGINPASPYWNPDPWLRDLLPPAAFADPTMHHIQIVFTGKVASLVAALDDGRAWARAMIERAAQIVQAVERTSWGADNAVLSGHRNWQDNKTDPGAGTIDRILDRYDALTDGSVTTVSLAERRLRTIRRLRVRLANAEAIIDAVRNAVGTEADT